MGTLTLKKKLTRTQKRRLAKAWLMENFVFYRDKMHPWKKGIKADVKKIYHEGEYKFNSVDIDFCLYIRHDFAEYDKSKPRVDVNGEIVDNDE